MIVKSLVTRPLKRELAIVSNPYGQIGQNVFLWCLTPKIQSIGTALIHGKNQWQIGKRDFRRVPGL